MCDERSGSKELTKLKAVNFGMKFQYHKIVSPYIPYSEKIKENSAHATTLLSVWLCVCLRIVPYNF
jgi:hypothetical protein